MEIQVKLRIRSIFEKRVKVKVRVREIVVVNEADHVENSFTEFVVKGRGREGGTSWGLEWTCRGAAGELQGGGALAGTGRGSCRGRSALVC